MLTNFLKQKVVQQLKCIILFFVLVLTTLTTTTLTWRDGSKMYTVEKGSVVVNKG